MNRLEARLFLTRRMEADFREMDLDDDTREWPEQDRSRVREEHRRMVLSISAKVSALEKRACEMKQKGAGQ